MSGRRFAPSAPQALVWAFALYLAAIGLGVGWMAPRLLVGYLSAASGILGSVLAIAASASESARRGYNVLAVVMLVTSVSLFVESVLPSRGGATLACAVLAAVIALFFARPTQPR